MQSLRLALIAALAFATFGLVSASAFSEDDKTMNTPTKAQDFADPDEKMPTIVFEPGQPLSYQQETPEAPAPNRYDPSNAAFSTPNLQPDTIRGAH